MFEIHGNTPDYFILTIKMKQQREKKSLKKKQVSKSLYHLENFFFFQK